jgi:metal iron transporter
VSFALERVLAVTSQSSLAIGIVGATVMPHSLFLGSALATQDRINSRPARDEDFIESTTSSKALESDESLDSAPSSRSEKLWASLKESILRMFKTPPKSLHATEATRHSDHETNPYDFVRAHIGHGVADVLIALLGFAVMINSMCVPYILHELTHSRNRINFQGS